MPKKLVYSWRQPTSRKLELFEVWPFVLRRETKVTFDHAAKTPKLQVTTPLTEPATDMASGLQYTWFKVHIKIFINH